jgi:hypothetical protein
MEQENSKIKSYISIIQKIIKYYLYFLIFLFLIVTLFDNSNTNAWWFIGMSFFIVFLLTCFFNFIEKIVK